jgi:predicted RNA-binding protein (virulence factor B family)
MKLGKINTLKVGRISQFGTYLIDDERNEVLLPDDYEGENLNLDDELEVFIYLNSDDQYVATTKQPLVQLNQFAYLRAKDVNRVGAFMDIGLPKDLMVPYAEQTEEMHPDRWYLVFMFIDEETDRLVGSCKEREFVFFDNIDIEAGDEVDLLLFRRTDLGMYAIVNNLYKGLIFSSDIHKDIEEGEKIKGFVKNIREDGKIDLLLEPLGYKKSINVVTDNILKLLAENDNCLFLTDKSSPEDIKRQLGISKKAFKRGLGSLYKQKAIEIFDDCIKLVSC